MIKALFSTYLICLCSMLSFGQQEFQKLDYFIGNWQGLEKGIAGQGVGYRTYGYELGKNYIFLHNQSSFPPSEKNPKGEVHRDIGVFSFDSVSNEVIFRSFNIEGFTNIFVLDKEASTTEKLVFVTRHIENNPGSWKARLTIEKLTDTEFRESFEIATDGKNFSSWLENHWYRQN